MYIISLLREGIKDNNSLLHRYFNFKKVEKCHANYLFWSLIRTPLSCFQKRATVKYTMKEMIEKYMIGKYPNHKKIFDDVHAEIGKLVEIFKWFIKTYPSESYNSGISMYFGIDFPDLDGKHKQQVSHYILHLMVDQGIIRRNKTEGMKRIYFEIINDKPYLVPKILGKEFLKLRINSYGELEFELFLIRYKIGFVKQKTFPGCKHKRLLPFDFYLTDYDILVEINGEQHYKFTPIFQKTHAAFEEQKNRDERKKKYAIDSGYGMMTFRTCKCKEKLGKLFFQLVESRGMKVGKWEKNEN